MRVSSSPKHEEVPGKTWRSYRRCTTHLRLTLIVVGHGMVGHRFVQAGIERGLTETHDIVVLGEEPRAAITGSLTSVFADDGADELSLLPEGKYADPRVRLVLGAAVTASERLDRAVTGDDSVAVLRLRPAGTERVTEPL